MSGYRERQDHDRYELMVEDEYAPAQVWADELGVRDFERRMGWQPAVDPDTRRGSYADLKDAKILAGECGMPACAGRLDEGCCVVCGQVARVGGSKGPA